MSSELLLVTLNARYQHSSFGLRYLYANLKELQARSRILEFTISQGAKDIAEKILVCNPRVVGFGVYIWNTVQTQEVVSVLKKLRPNLLIVLGGPEVSYETETQAICQLADYTIQGESDVLFYEFSKKYLETGLRPEKKWISGELPDLQSLSSPYSYYSDDDVQNRVIYVEASRGCPYKCEYCLSSLDKSVRNFPLEPFLADMQKLIDRGVRQFKFVDRTFNLSIPISTRILSFFLDRMDLGLFIHFELVPDRLPKELRDLIVQFPKGSLQFEIGIQTWSPEVSKLISRRQDYAKIRENFKFLNESTGVHTHADLIFGLPGETLESFAIGFDALNELRPDEVQLGILKRLKGTPIMRHDQEWGMIYQEQPPFQILQTKLIDFNTLQKIVRFSKHWDLVANSGNFVKTMQLLRTSDASSTSLFWTFLELSEFLSLRHTQSHGIALIGLVESMWIYLTLEKQLDSEWARAALIEDYTGSVKRDIPWFLRSAEPLARPSGKSPETGIEKRLPERQRRHLSQ